MSSDVRHVLDIGDLTDAEIDTLISARAPADLPPRTVVALLFLSASLRTRVGFASAAIRLGGHPISVDAFRSGAEMSQGESFADTLRTLSGMADIVVVRSNEHLDRDFVRNSIPTPVINAGDPQGEHPTQALIDVAAMQRFCGPIEQLQVGICGDLTMRASRSLLGLLARRPPASLALIAPPARSDHGVDLGRTLPARTHTRSSADFAELDVVLMTGLAPGVDGELDDDARQQFALTATTVRSLEPDAVVLSPMPVIDEIAGDQRTDPRVRIFDQSDLGVGVRAAVLRLVLG